MQLKDMAGMLKQVQEMSKKMEEIQRELARRSVTADAGGGMVKVTANGKHELVKVEIEKELINPDEVDMLQDLIVAAANKALAESAKMAQEEIAKVTVGSANLGMLKDIGLGT
ncbi:MAG: YbaB/EbfC family nucleoid-associated protein [Chloroherpetonaceae bacterium]